MRNLYRRMNCAPTATLAELQASVQSISDQGLKSDAEAVFRNSERRRAYDRLNGLLVDIGELRESLELDRADNWRPQDRQEYCRGNGPASALEALEQKFKAGTKPGAKTAKPGPGGTTNPLDFFALFLLLAIPLVIVFSQIESSSSRPSAPAGTPASRPSRAPEVPVVNTQPLPPVQATPESGRVRRHSYGSGEAPLRIETRSGAHYILKMVDATTGQDVLDVFIQGGNSVDIDVPFGSYIVRYASGDVWYGYHDLFGPETSYSQADQRFVFERIGNQVSGYTITLYRVHNGNLRTKNISAHDF